MASEETAVSNIINHDRLLEATKRTREYPLIMEAALRLLLKEGPLNEEEVKTLLTAESRYCEAEQNKAREQMESYSRHPHEAIKAAVQWAALGTQRGKCQAAWTEIRRGKDPHDRPETRSYLSVLDARVSWYEEGGHSQYSKEEAVQMRENIQKTIQLVCPRP